MIKQNSLIVMEAVGTAAFFLGTSHASAFAACTGNPLLHHSGHLPLFHIRCVHSQNRTMHVPNPARQTELK